MTASIAFLLTFLLPYGWTFQPFNSAHILGDRRQSPEVFHVFSVCAWPFKVCGLICLLACPSKRRHLLHGFDSCGHVVYAYTCDLMKACTNKLIVLIMSPSSWHLSVDNINIRHVHQHDICHYVDTYSKHHDWYRISLNWGNYSKHSCDEYSFFISVTGSRLYTVVFTFFN